MSIQKQPQGETLCVPPVGIGLKENYKSVILPTFSNIFERIIFVQISAFLTVFSKNINADFGKAIVLNIAIGKC